MDDDRLLEIELLAKQVGAKEEDFPTTVGMLVEEMIPELVAEVRRLREENDRLRQEMSDAGGYTFG